MAKLVSLSCPVCGAPLPPNTTRCVHCGSTVVFNFDMARIDPSTLKHAVIDEHIGEYRTAVRRDNNDEVAHYGLGVAYFNLGLLDEAIAELGVAASLVPENPYIQFQLAVVHAQLIDVARLHPATDPHRRQALFRVNRTLRLRPTMCDALLLKAEFLANPEYLSPRFIVLEQLAEEKPLGLLRALELWRRVHAISPDAIRDPIRRLLNTGLRLGPVVWHPQTILQQSSQFRVSFARRKQNEERRRALAEVMTASVQDSSHLLTVVALLGNSIPILRHSIQSRRR